METKNFLGLDGLNHFWEKAKIWIINEITAKIAGIVLSSVPTGTVLQGLYTTVPNGFLLCNGQEVSITSFHKLYTEIGSLACCQSSNTGMFKIPDLREVVFVGAGQSTRAKIATHDVYALGEFKDDQLQAHKHEIRRCNGGGSIGQGWYITDDFNRGTSNGGDVLNTFDCRHGTTTHGKQFGVNYIIKY